MVQVKNFFNKMINMKDYFKHVNLKQYILHVGGTSVPLKLESS